MEESITLNPKVKISDLDIGSLPLCNFHIVILVEPDPESWAIPPDKIDSLSELLDMYSELIIDDAIGEFDPNAITTPIAKDVENTLIIMASESMGDYFFEPVMGFCAYVIHHNDFEFERLGFLLDGIAKNHPAWNRAAIIGGVYEDEIIRAANTVQAAGFDTTIVTRYCLSEKVFLNLDDVFDALNAERKKMLGDLWESDTDNI